MGPDPAPLAPFLDRLREVPFVRALELTTAPGRGQAPGEPVLRVRTARRTFPLALEIKRTFLDRTVTNAIIAEHAAHRKHGRDLLLLARYIPRPTGERLADAGVNFVDYPGNVHLRLGKDYQILVLGRRVPAVDPLVRRPGPALVQVCFVLLAEPAAAAWPVRHLADQAGIGKTAAATVRQRLVRAGVLTGGRAQGLRVADRPRMVDDFLRGYAEILRPHLEIGRFRAPERDPEGLVRALASTAEELDLRWALTGALAAYALDRFYRGDDVTVFLDGFTRAFQRALHLVPDRNGPIRLLRPFSRRWNWKVTAAGPVAHPWLVYAELLDRGEPRALEAAQQIRERFLEP